MATGMASSGWSRNTWMVDRDMALHDSRKPAGESGMRGLGCVRAATENKS